MNISSEWQWGITTSNKLNVRKAPSLSAPRWNNVWPLGRIALLKPVADRPDWYETTYRGETAYVSAAFITILADAVPQDIRDRIKRIGDAEIGRKGSVYFNGYNGMWCHRFADWLVMHTGSRMTERITKIDSSLRLSRYWDVIGSGKFRLSNGRNSEGKRHSGAVV